MPTTVKPGADIQAFQKAEQAKFWELHPALLGEMRNSWKAAGKPFPTSVTERGFLEQYMAGETGLYGPEWPASVTGARVYYPEKTFRELLKFLIDKHNLVVQSIRDDAESTRLYKEWLKTYSPFGELNETIKSAALLVGAVVLGWLIIK